MSTLFIDKAIQVRFNEVRALTVAICKPLIPEDYVVQPIVDTSPPKWHLGHTTWFFESFILEEYLPGYQIYDSGFAFVFNSYYEGKGKRILRTDRGNLSRPDTKEVYNYRTYVDTHMKELLSTEDTRDPEIAALIEIGLNHEQQHQELLLADIKFILGNNPLLPQFVCNQRSREKINSDECCFLPVESGVYEIGHEGDGFSFDNELGRHKVYVEGFEIASQLVSNGEYMQFISEGGYENFSFWLEEGWQWVKENEIDKPMYWHKEAGEWKHYTFSGLLQIDTDEPVMHVSFFEADAFARWKGMRLPTEFEWEVAAKMYDPVISEDHTLLKIDRLFPYKTNKAGPVFVGCAWQWTNSAYLPYPKFKPPLGALGEYNGKFMINQMVLRGGSFATPFSHIRHSYRNFYHADKRMLFSGIRLAT